MTHHRYLSILMIIVISLAITGQPAVAQPSAQADQPQSPLPSEGEIKAEFLQKWSDDFRLGVGYKNGAESFVSALAFDGQQVYVGGSFDYAGSLDVQNLTRWDGSQWLPWGTVSGRVNAIAVSSEDVYIAGNFTSVSGVEATILARWNKTSGQWSAIPNSPSSSVYALSVAGNGDLYIGGDFDAVGAVSAHNIAYYNKTTGWHALGNGTHCSPEPCFDSVTALHLDGSNVYAGGVFDYAGGVGAKNLARWDGAVWHSVGGGVNGPVRALGMSGSTLYVGGFFTQVNVSGTPLNAPNIAAWNNTNWNTMAGGVNDYVHAIQVRSDGVYVGGDFTTAGVIEANHVACWNGTSWSKLMSDYDVFLSGVNDTVMALTGDDTRLFIGGAFTQAGYRATPNRVVEFDGSNWNSLGDSVSYHLHSLYTTESSNFVYVGGLFESAGGVSQLLLARWDKTSHAWSEVGDGADITGCLSNCPPTVEAILIDGIYIYIGGNFTSVGGMAANNIARYNQVTGNWSNLDGGVNFSDKGFAKVYTMLASDGGLYVGGNFDTAGGLTVNNIAFWNGTNWQALQDPTSTGTDNIVKSLTSLSNGNIAVGGLFTSPFQALAQWNGSIWSSLGPALSSGAVYTMVGDGSSANPLYIGGSFTSPNHIAKLSMLGWAELGAGLNGDVYTLVKDPVGNLYAGGTFTSSGVIGLNRIGMWDRSSASWHNLGMGMDNYVYTLDYANGWLYAGGSFKTADGKPSVYLARWGIPNPVYLPLIIR